MPSITRFPATPDPETPLRATNGKIAALAAVSPYRDIHAAFARVAQLASEALTIAAELQLMPGIDAEQRRLVVAFWYSLSDQARIAALACVGGSQSLADATVAFLFLQQSCARKPAGSESIEPAEGDGKVARS